MQPATHRIRRQTWHCRARSAEEAFALRSALRQAQERAVPDAFEQAFDAAVPGDEVVHLPRLELRIRLTGVDDLAAVLPELLARALHEQLAEQLEQTPGFDRSVSRRTERAGAWREAPAVKTARESRRDALIVYLTTGALPWELAQDEATALKEQLRETAAAELEEILAGAPREEMPLAQRIAFFFRLLQVLPEERWAEVAEHPGWRSLVRAVEAVHPVVFSDLLLPTGAVNVAEVRRVLAEMMAAFPGALGGTAAGTSPPSPLSHRTPIPRERGSQTPRDREEDEPPAEGGGAPSPGGRVCDGRGGQGVRSQTPEPPISSPTAVKPEPSTEPSPLFPLAVRSAGLVLLHPFLPRLFESTGLLRPGDPGLPWAGLPRAAALLCWLATGREEVLEFELALIKVLLGRRPEEPLLVSHGLLTAADLEEGEALLQAVIGHWKALRSTTPAGLRASFLQRGGLLRARETGWHLQVAPAAFDLLLDQLPWGLGVVKLPWMTQPIFTEWPTP